MKIHHVGIAVKSLDEASGRFGDLLGLEKAERYDLPEFGVSALFMPVGDSNLEFLEPLGDASTVGKFIEKRGEGVHHICFEVDDLHLVGDDLTNDGLTGDVIFRIIEGPRVHVDGYRIRGNTSLPDRGALFWKDGLTKLADLQLHGPRLFTPSGAVFNTEFLDADLLAMRKVYRDNGFLDAVVELEHGAEAPHEAKDEEVAQVVGADGDGRLALGPDGESRPVGCRQREQDSGRLLLLVGMVGSLAMLLGRFHRLRGGFSCRW